MMRRIEMASSREEALQKMRRELDAIAKKNREAFEGTMATTSTICLDCQRVNSTRSFQK